MTEKLPKDFSPLLDEYHSLLNKKYSIGLYPDEAEKLEKVGRAIDEYHAPFYHPIIEELKEIVDRMRKING